MSRKAFFSVIGAYNEDNTIFDGIHLPDKIVTEGFEDLFQEMPAMEKAVFINNLLCELGELSLKHTNVAFLKFEIEMWSEKNYYNWCQLYETTFYKYNPLWNYIMHRRENTLDDLLSNKTGNANINKTETVTDNLQEDIVRDGTSEDDTVNKVAGFDSTTPTIHDTSDNDRQWEDSSRKTNTGTKTKGSTEADSNSEQGSENRTIDLTYKAMGSLGTSNLASAIAAQRRIIINMYDYIIDAFKQRFCLLVY